jgi:protein-S-isoprenylcysteine O-methyltransferase Ste14
MNAAMLVSALAITIYFVAGSWLEERKLIAIHGDTYRRYRERVPGLLPLPWKWLGRDEAANFH